MSGLCGSFGDPVLVDMWTVTLNLIFKLPGQMLHYSIGMFIVVVAVIRCCIAEETLPIYLIQTRCNFQNGITC